MTQPNLLRPPLLAAMAFPLSLLLSACGGGSGGGGEGVGITANNAPDWISGFEALLDEMTILSEVEERLDLGSIEGTKADPELCENGQGSRYVEVNHTDLPLEFHFNNCLTYEYEDTDYSEQEQLNGFLKLDYGDNGEPSEDFKNVSIRLTLINKEDRYDDWEDIEYFWQDNSKYSYDFAYERVGTTYTYSELTGSASFKGNEKQDNQVVDRWDYTLKLRDLTYEHDTANNSIAINGELAIQSKEPNTFNGGYITVSTIDGPLRTDSTQYNLLCHTGGSIRLEDSRNNAIQLDFPDNDGGELQASINGVSETFDNCDTFMDILFDD